MANSDVVAALRSTLPDGRVKSDGETLEAYRFDETTLTDAGIPAVVVFPRSTEEVQSAVRVAAERRIPIVPRGAGSGLAGGANAIDGCIVLSLTAMNEIVTIDPHNQLAVAQPGVITADVNRAAIEHGLFYPPDPASFEFCTIGGNIATNAGGLCCVKYGVTGDFVLGLEVVLADASVIRIGRRSRKGVAGYDLVHLFIGSEGTLGIVTEATLRLRPATQPPGTLVASFATVRAAGEAITAIATTLTPSRLELMDRTTIGAVERWKPMGLGTEPEALLLVQSDSAEQEAELSAVETICKGAGAAMLVRSSDPAEAELLMTARRLAHPALKLLGDTLSDDVAVPTRAIPALLAGIDEIARTTGVTVGTFGHAGDGNMHPTILFDQFDPESVDKARTAFDKIIRLTMDLGGTITGEHGVGILKLPYLKSEIGERAHALHASIKTALDPLGILNPGKAF
ncbi:MAG: FAD-binding oxidoreductase [Actinomycetota bacterium]